MEDDSFRLLSVWESRQWVVGRQSIWMLQLLVCYWWPPISFYAILFSFDFFWNNMYVNLAANSALQVVLYKLFGSLANFSQFVAFLFGIFPISFLFLFGWSLVFKWLFCWNCLVLLLAANFSFTSSRVIPFQFKGLQTSLSLWPFYLEFFLEICLVGHRFYKEWNYWICYFCWPPILLYN